MATKKRLSLIYELENFANTYLGKVTKFQVDGLFRFGVLNNLLAWRWKHTPPPGANRVKPGLHLVVRPTLSKYIVTDIVVIIMTYEENRVNIFAFALQIKN